MLWRTVLLAAGLSMLTVAALVFVFISPRARVIGGLGFTVGLSYIGMLVGTLMVIVAVPRRAGTVAGVMVIVALSLFAVLWPSWEVRIFPHVMSLEQVFSVLDPGGTGSALICAYTKSGALWISSNSPSGDDMGRIIGFYARGLTLSERIRLLSLGLVPRPVWPLSGPRGQVHWTPRVNQVRV